MSPSFLKSLLLLSVLSVCYCADCDTYTDCETCSEAKTWVLFLRLDCLWCPLDRKCHTWGSQFTPCFDNLDINEKEKCFDEPEGTYDPDKAYVNTLLSSAAYGNDVQQCLDTYFPADDYDVKQVIAVRCDNFYSEYDECIGYTAVSTSKKSIYISYRGSISSEQVIDQVLSALFEGTKSFKIGGTVVDYFGDTHDAIYPCIQSQFQSLRLQYPSYKVVVTGHSLGGALASMTAASLIYDGDVAASDLELYTFGMPRVGDKRYAYEFDRLVQNSWNVVNYRDIVPHTPFCNALGCNIPYDGAFHHKREVYYGNYGDMTTSSSYTVCHENEDSSCSNKAVSRDPCTDLETCITYHLNYFNTDVGDHCFNILGDAVLPKPWSGELSRTCHTFVDK